MPRAGRAFAKLRERQSRRLSDSRRAAKLRAEREEAREQGELDDNMERRLARRWRALRLYGRWDKKLSERVWRELPMEVKAFLLKWGEAEEEKDGSDRGV